MIKIIGTNQGLRGDLIMGTVVARAIKEKNPDCHFTLGVNNLFSDMNDLFKNNPYIDEIHNWTKYDLWPGQMDIDYLENNKYDLILNPMPQHPNSHCWWMLVKNQCEASCIANGLTPPSNLQCYLEKWFKIPNYRDCITIFPFTNGKEKNLSIEKWQKIIDYISNQGLIVIQLGTKEEFKFNNTLQLKTDYFESTKIMLGSIFTIGLDSSCAWLSSAYNHNFLGLFGYLSPYPGLDSSKLYQPINPNGHYLEAPRAEDIPNELIFNKIDEMIDKYY